MKLKTRTANLCEFCLRRRRNVVMFTSVVIVIVIVVEIGVSVI